MSQFQRRRSRSSLAIVLAGCLSFLAAAAPAQEETVKEANPNGPPATMRLGEIELPLVFQEDFASDRSRWETTDDQAWELRDSDHDHGKVLALNRRISDYQPTHRSPHNIALVRELELGDFVLLADVRNLADTGGHRDGCIFFTHRSPTQFYYVHLGAQPDPASGQIMIVADAPRRPLTDNKHKIAWDDGWHRVKVTRESVSGAIAVYFDDMQRPVMQATDKTFDRGRLGIGSFDDVNEFDNVLIYGR